MSSVCRSSLSCVDVRESARASYKTLYKWPESDAEFVKSMAAGRRRGERGDPSGLNSGTNLEERRRPSAGPSVVDSYSCRQLYLRSYVFTKEETVSEKMKRYCFRKEKKTAAVLPIFASGSTVSSGGADVDTKRNGKHKKTKKDCAAIMKLRDFLHRLLCTAGNNDKFNG
ncbi:hypothetical protein C4D60_Mb10t27800 [Musa balbisiana]|uniref:Uncharacterized protein n=1 Tax=Musa balbisiana TaxID=52838 RepID=A0A4S8J0A2_MUSBA|nr:hypothetical protein C4D60_Mb10t27800 [Musa balbisiana]